MKVEELKDHLDSYRLVDVRTHREWDAGHLPEAIHIPLDELSARDLPGGDKPVVFVCRTGVRSGAAVERMSERGLAAHNLEGGLAALVAGGTPLVDSSGQAGRLADWDAEAEPENLAPDLAHTRDSFLEVIFGLQQRYGNREPTDEEAREFMREWLESKGKSPEEIEEILSGG
jgi:rhodanese-related sulfurtransferase